jgi:hypothetical protein
MGFFSHHNTKGLTPSRVGCMMDPQATQVQTENVVGRLANATLAGFNDINVKIDVLVDSQIRTDETLRNLTAAIDRYFSESRNPPNDSYNTVQHTTRSSLEWSCRMSSADSPGGLLW